MRRDFIITLVVVLVLIFGFGYFYPFVLWSLVVVVPLSLVGLYDFFQVKHTIRRNFPLIGHLRYFFELIRPEINQYFVESNTDGAPFSREERSIVYQRAKRSMDTLPFGTQKDVYETGYEWVNHSLHPKYVDPESLRITIGGPQCKKPYSASILNISAMSFGALSKNAVISLNKGAEIGNFSHNTGEGGLTNYHQQGGDIVWQIGTGYFGCRTPEGTFCPDQFKEKANSDHVKMIEIKLSQGAKPGHGGILPAAKITPEIAEIRNVPMGQDVLSPPAHSSFSTPEGLLEFVQTLRDLTGGKPIGFKLCIGKRREFIAICKAIISTGIYPDYIVVDGGEGGTGAAPLEFSNHIGTPLVPALVFVHNVLLGFGIRDKIRVISSGKVTSGFGIVKQLCIGADACNSARAMMMALGCVQALRCNNNTCPVGVTTQNPILVAGLVVSDKKVRVANYHKETVNSVAEIIGTMGIEHTEDLRQWHIMIRTAPNEVKHYGEIYEYLHEGDLLKDENLPATFERAYKAAVADTFEHIEDISGRH